MPAPVRANPSCDHIYCMGTFLGWPRPLAGASILSVMFPRWELSMMAAKGAIHAKGLCWHPWQPLHERAGWAAPERRPRPPWAAEVALK